ncbi:hypothetical protein ACFVFQ_26680 [Streptomyces sp. NPDC057743]|uniref:hypothetical protein n=1 Tax=Streptomyces sp. NPDC057743 TaxID=3346236 RepID=UPI0036D12E96
MTSSGVRYLPHDPAEPPVREGPVVALEPVVIAPEPIAEGPAAPGTVQKQAYRSEAAHTAKPEAGRDLPADGVQAVDTLSAELAEVASVFAAEADTQYGNDSEGESETLFLASPSSPSSTWDALLPVRLKQLVDQAYGNSGSDAPSNSRQVTAALAPRAQQSTLRQWEENHQLLASAGWDARPIDVLRLRTGMPLDCDTTHPFVATCRNGDRLDAIESLLRKVDRPLALDELKSRNGISISSNYLRQQINADPRFSRSHKDEWALVEWGLPVYKPIKELVSDMLDEHGGAVDADQVVHVLRRDFAIKETSLRQVMSSSPFTARGGVVRRLTDVDLPGPAAPPTRFSDEQPKDEAPDVDALMDNMGLT